MNVGIRRVGIAVTLLVLVLVGQLTYLQIIEADRLENDPRNVRNLIRDFNRPRGDIITADGEIVAESLPVDEAEFDFQRVYPEGPLYAQVSGYQSFVVGNTGVEKEYNDDLVGRTPELQIGNVRDLILGKQQTGTVVLTLESAVQLAARDALGDRAGSVVALDPSTGGVLAMYSNPTYDPNPLAGHDTQAVDAFFDVLSADPAKPDLPRSYREIYPPGSSFKTVTAGVALDDGVVTPDTEFPSVSSIPLPLTDTTLSNFGGGVCGGDLFESFTRSCNTTFARIGLDLGNAFVSGMQGFGVYEEPPLDLDPGAVASTGPPTSSFDHDDPEFALAGIGQGMVATTPLQMALVASGVANGGVINQPHVADEILDSDGVSVDRIDPGAWKRAMSPGTATTVSEMMVSVVENGTGGAAAIPGVSVAGKTGTAQVGDGTVDVWFIAFAPVEDPQVAVAVIVEGTSVGSEATGGEVAAPIARTVIEAALGVQ
jgi:peptidoglycan glycosyltransferase